LSSVGASQSSTGGSCGGKKTQPKKARTPVGRLDDSWETSSENVEPQNVREKLEEKTQKKEDPFAPFPGAKNPVTGEIGGQRGPEPTRYGDWEKKGRTSDF